MSGRARPRFAFVVRGMVMDEEQRQASIQRRLNVFKRARIMRLQKRYDQEGRKTKHRGERLDRQTEARQPPLEVLLDRDRRLNAPRTLTMILCGDPV